MLIGIIAFGLVIGGVTGLVGAGGGILAIPALVYVAGVPLETAVSTSLVMGAVSPIAALVPRLKGGVAWRTVIVVSIAGIPSAFAGTAVGTLLPEHVVLIAFAALMVLAGIQMLRGRRGGAAELDAVPRLWIVRGLAIGVVVGFLTGLLGIGGGFITVPALVLALGMPMGLAVGTSLAVALINSLAGIFAHAGTTSPDWTIAVAFALPAIVGSLITARIATRVSNRVLQLSFAVMVFFVAAITVLRVVLA